MDAYLGIDLGTTNSVVAYYIPQRECKVVNIQGKDLFRSAAKFVSDGSIKVGSIALQRPKDIAEGNVVTNVKRVIGKQYSDPIISKVEKSCKATVTADEQGYAAFCIPSQHRIVKPSEICAQYIDKLYDEASQFLHDYTIKGVAVTVPAMFTSDQRLATMNAIKTSKITVPVRLLTEPSAAAISFNIQNEINDGYILVYDLGGGTFDVSLASITNGNQFKIINTDGSIALGGEDFDLLILEKIRHEYFTEFNCDILPSNQNKENNLNYIKAYSKLLHCCREAKETLSIEGMNIVPIDLSDYLNITNSDDDDDDDDCDLEAVTDYQLSLSEYIAMIKDDIDTTINITLRCIANAGLTSEQIDRIIMVGGSSRTPYILQRLNQTFGLGKVLMYDPDLCVAKGAAYYCAASNDIIDLTFEDCCRYDICTQVYHHHRVELRPIIKKGTPLPCIGTAEYRVKKENEGCIEDAIFEGDLMVDRALNVLCTIECTNVTIQDEDVIVCYTLELSKDGIISYSIIEKESGRILVNSHVLSRMA